MCHAEMASHLPREIIYQKIDFSRLAGLSEEEPLDLSLRNTDQVYLHGRQFQYGRQDDSEISYELEAEDDPLQTVEEQKLDVNIAIHYIVKEEELWQESCMADINTHAWQVKCETLAGYSDFTESCDYKSVRSTDIIGHSGCYIDATGMGINKSRRNSHNTIDIVDTKLEYNPMLALNMHTQSLTPCKDSGNAEKTMSHSFSPAKDCRVLKNNEDTPDNAISSEIDISENEVGNLLTPIKKRVSYLSEKSGAKKMRWSADKNGEGLDEIKNTAKSGPSPGKSGDRLPAVKLTSKSNGKSSQSNRTPKSRVRLSNRNTTMKNRVSNGKTVSDKSKVRVSKGKTSKSKENIGRQSNSVKSRTSVRKVVGTSERRQRVLSRNAHLKSTSSTAKGKDKTTYSCKRRYKRQVPIGILRCSKCHFLTSRPKILANHELLHSQGLICRWCNVKCSSLQALSRHSLVHEEAKSFGCSLCDYACKYLWMLHVHRSTAHPELSHPGAASPGKQSYNCQACKYSCNKISMLKRHMLIHLQFRPYSCKLCNFTCNVKYNLKLHMLRHTREKPHVCGVCGMRFGRSYSLRAHSSVHTGAKPHACDECNFTCAHFSSLKRHRLMHVTHSRLCCPTCNFACKLLATFLKHRATEHGERGLYACTLCHAGLDNTRQLARHLWQHKNEGKYGNREETFRLPKYLVRIRNKKRLLNNETEREDAERVLKLSRRVPKVSNDISIGKIITTYGNRVRKNIDSLSKSTKIVGRTPTKKIIKGVGEAPTKIGKAPDYTKVLNSFLQLKVVCRKLTISEIIRRRVNNN